jgi:hypothetical protein
MLHRKDGIKMPDVGRDSSFPYAIAILTILPANVRATNSESREFRSHD